MTTNFAPFARVAAAALALAIPSAAIAGACPPGKSGTGLTADAGLPASGVTDTVLATIDVASEPAKIDGRSFRLRRLEIAPGGVVPWHSHSDRPAIIYVVSGEVTEYASTCSVPIVHKAGEAIPELHATSHYWRNTGKTKAVLLSSDLLPVGGDAKMM
jgi:quercetin dioxygenase-like cupin family protein